MGTRALTSDDSAALEALLMRAPAYNLFHLGALAEHGLGVEGGTWAVGAFRDSKFKGAVVGLRGTGGVYHTPGDDEVLSALSAMVIDKAAQGRLSLLSGHDTQIGPLLPLIQDVGVGQPDRCYFRALVPGDLHLPAGVEGFGPPRLGTEKDMERLIDFYEVGFYSLAHLPSRAAWRNRLSEQLAFRSLFLIEDKDERVVSAALSSAEGGHGAMLGGVATLEEYRGRGLSALCVGALCRHLFGRGAESVSLFYLKDNAAAGRVYDKLGFREAGEWLLAPLGMGVMFGPLLGMGSR